MPRESLIDLLAPGQSPYVGMYRAALFGYTVDECAQHCATWGIPLRKKDYENWSRGAANYEARYGSSLTLDPEPPKTSSYQQILGKKEEDLKFQDLLSFPPGWKGCSKRFFPCSETNQPLISWGWRADRTPALQSYQEAKRCSPVGWVGQNLMYQTFVVIDIDGVGHGERDESVIQFGSLFKDRTLCLEDPRKPGSFHLYFSTHHIIPIKHFPWAKIDLMGNEKNAAVYFKNKQSNGKPMAEFTEPIWNALMAYQNERKKLCH